METEARLRRDVAIANRIIERVGLSNAFGHVSARIPGTSRFLLPRRRSPGFTDPDGLLSDLIVTEPGVGYRIRDPDRDADPEAAAAEPPAGGPSTRP